MLLIIMEEQTQKKQQQQKQWENMNIILIRCNATSMFA